MNVTGNIYSTKIMHFADMNDNYCISKSIKGVLPSQFMLQVVTCISRLLAKVRMQTKFKLCPYKETICASLLLYHKLHYPSDRM